MNAGAHVPHHKARVTRLKIEKFRAIAKADIELGETVALVGQNGSGKTSVLRALNAFFNLEQEREDFLAGRHDYTRSTTSIIEVTITGMKEPGIPCVKEGLDEVRARLKFRRQEKWECWTEGGWRPAPADFHRLLSKYIAYALIPIRRDHAVAHDSSTGLLVRAVERWIDDHSQRDRVSPKVSEMAIKLQERSLLGLQNKLRAMAPMDGAFSFELGYTILPDYRVLLQNLALTVREGGQVIQLADAGSGTQSMAVFALYAHLAEIENTNFLLGLEEPEQNLHPQAQQQLMRNLEKLGLQVVFTTHSPTIVDMLDHEHVVLCKRVRGRQRELEILVSQIKHSFFSDAGIDRDAYYKFHGRRNSEFLFADFVVVTESPVDAAVISQLLTSAGDRPDSLGMSIVPLDGGVTHGSVDHMFHLLRTLSIPAAYVLDRDYFLPYLNDKRELSLDGQGFPLYKNQLQRRTLLDAVVDNDATRKKIAADLYARPSSAMKQLIQYGFFCFMWALEVDLVNAKGPRERLYESLRMPDDGSRSPKSLLEKKKAIKKQEYLITAIDGLPATALPRSYQALRRELPRLARESRAL